MQDTYFLRQSHVNGADGAEGMWTPLLVLVNRGKTIDEPVFHQNLAFLTEADPDLKPHRSDSNDSAEPA